MNERDRVMNAFRNCITEPKCKNCPWDECEALGNRKVEIPLDLALAVMRELAATEPRVMTLEEVHSAGEHNADVFDDYYAVIVWVEEKNQNPYPARIRYSFYPEYGDDEDDDRVACASFGSDCDEWAQSKFYGVTWRCWTSRPTDEEREAVKWDD